MRRKGYGNNFPYFVGLGLNLKYLHSSLSQNIKKKHKILDWISVKFWKNADILRSLSVRKVIQFGKMLFFLVLPQAIRH